MNEKLELTKKQKIYDRSVFLGLALTACVLTFLVCPFSPIYRYNFEPDELCYHTVSLGWLRGKIPYRDLFDHKGPLTYIIYMLGLLLTGRNAIGIMFVFMAINTAIFIMIYRINRLCFDQAHSLCSTILLLTFFFVKKQSLYASGTKPDHFILLILLVSEFIYIRGIKRYRLSRQAGNPSSCDSLESDASKDSASELPAKRFTTVFSSLEMLLLGLGCGVVFMIKLNACIYYLLFIGFYLLWLLIRKNWKSFFASCGLFLLGIGAVSAPFVIYFSYHHALSDFFFAYFQFNSAYAKDGGLHLLFSRPFIDPENSLIIILLFLLLLLSTFVFLNAKGSKHTRTILVLCGAVTYGFIAFQEVFIYTFVLLIPLYIWGCAVLVDLLFAFLSLKAMRIATCALSIFILFNFTLFHLVLYPAIPKEISPEEQIITDYIEAHPDSTTLYFFNLCFIFSPNSMETTPDFRYFFMPRSGTEEIYTSQADYIRNQIPDIICFYSTSIDDEYMKRLDDFFAENEYSLLCVQKNDEYHVYVRSSTLT